MTTLSVDLLYRPRDWQKECHRNKKRFTVLALHRRSGKTELAIMELINAALKFDQNLGLFFYVAPYLKQAKLIAWQRLKQRLSPLLIANAITINESELSIILNHNGSVIRIFGADNPDAMRGVRLDYVVIDEVAQIKPEVWDEILQPALSDRKGRALFIGTPNGINLFSQLFYRSNKYDDWHGALYTVYQTSSIDDDEITRLKRDMSDNAWNREYLCDFSASGEDQLISLADVEDAARRQVNDADIYYAPLIVGVDPARFGVDRSVIVKRQGLKVYTPIIFNGIDNMALAAKVASIIDNDKPSAVFIDSGAGGGVIDRLRQLGHDVIEVAFAGKPINDKYLNKRVEIWSELKDWLLAGGSIPNDMSIKQDLAAPTYKYNANGKIQLESKDDIKKRGLPSPDIGDALALTFSYPVRPKNDLLIASRVMDVSDRQRGHDPFKTLFDKR